MRANGLARFVAVALPLLLLAACSGLQLGTAMKLRALDPLNDDIAGLIFAVDVPRVVEPIPGASIFRLDAVTKHMGERHVVAVLQHAEDVGELVASLPPPALDRTYYLFAFAEEDRDRIREVQAWIRGLKQNAAGENVDGQLTITVEPRLCESAAIDPNRATYSVLLALPGSTALEPIMRNASFASLLENSGSDRLPACAGHSG